MSVLNLIEGSGGKGHEPGSHFTFIQETSNGTAPNSVSGTCVPEIANAIFGDTGA